MGTLPHRESETEQASKLDQKKVVATGAKTDLGQVEIEAEASR